MSEASRRRLIWVQLFLECRDAGKVCRHCGISRPTPRKWVRRGELTGEAGLIELSRRPHHITARKVTAEDRAAIHRLRAKSNGARRIQTELRLHADR